MKISATFEDEDEALEAIHASHAWMALREINDVLRQNKKYDLPCEEAVSQIQASVADALSLLYTS
jgi:hypothetical protein